MTMIRTARPKTAKPIGTVRKDFVMGAHQYRTGDPFPRDGQDRPSIIELRGLMASQLVAPDLIPGPGDEVGQGFPNPNAIPRGARILTAAE